MTKLHWRIAIISMGVVVSVLAMTGVVLASNARNQLEDSWSSLDRVWTSLNDTPGTELTLADFERLRASVLDLDQSLGSAKRQTFFLQPFTFLSADLDTSLQSLDAAEELALAANDILTGIQPTLFFLTQGEEGEKLGTQISSSERVVELLSLGRGNFMSAEAHLFMAQTVIDNLDVAQVSPSLLSLVDGLTQYHSQLLDITHTLLNTPDLLTTALGLVDTQTYLILSQNSDELRPSGGYISTYGWITVRNGRLIDYNYYPTTPTSPNPPPASLAGEVKIPDWWIQYDQPIYAAWDGSWYADFPSTARMATWFYDNGGNPESPVDGVIAIDLVGFQYILEGLGSVTVPDYNETVTAENFRDVVYQIRAEGEHKPFVASVYRQILAGWQAADQQQSIDIRGALLRGLQEKHIMLYFTDETLNRALDLLDWAGTQKSGTRDYLMVADANLGNKSNHSILRQLTYDVDIQPDGSLHSRVSISYDYSARVAKEDPAVRPAHYGSDPNYHNLLQVFVPAQSTLTSTDNLTREPITVSTDALTSFVALTQVDYDQSERFQFSYTVPVLVEHFGPYHRYKLLLQKQPGMLGEAVSVQVTLPAGAAVVSTSPAAAASYQLEQPVLEFRVDLITDQTIEVIYTGE